MEETLGAGGCAAPVGARHGYHPVWGIAGCLKEKNAMAEPDLHLLHDPFGRGDFYNPDPTDRKPHLPVAGRPLVLCAATWPEGRAGRVWAEWAIDGAPGGIAEGARAAMSAGPRTTASDSTLTDGNLDAGF